MSNRLAFLIEPSKTVAGHIIAPSVQVELQDENGIRIPGATDNVSLAFGIITPAILSGTLPRAAVDGVATFDDLSVDLPGRYNLIPGAGPFISPLSLEFLVTPDLGATHTLDAALVSLVAADPPLVDAIGARFYPVDEAPQNGPLPYVTYTVIDHPSVHVMGRDSLAQPRVQFDCFAATRTGARAIGALIVSAFDRQTWTAGGIRVTAAICLNRGMDFDREDATLRPRRLVEFGFTYELP